MALLCLLATLLGGTRDLPARPPEAPSIQRFVEGIDPAASSMSGDEVAAELNDPWAVLVLRKGVFPEDITSALTALNSPDGQAAYSVQQSFFVSESGQLPLAATIAREFRMVILRSKPTESLPGVLISAPAGRRQGFIELMGWDPTKKAFNFYRSPQGGTWTWKGDTRSAFRPASAGKGCFQCHVHGTTIMKELRSPWNNWHSQAASIPPEAIPSLEIRNSPLFLNKSQAEELEPLVKGWISTAMTELVKDAVKGDRINDANLLLRPLFETDTVNLQSSQQRSRGLSRTMDLPPDFFLNFQAFSNLFGLETLPSFNGLVDRSKYQAAVQAFDFRLSDGAGFTQAGDTHFGFLVPVPSESDMALVRQLVGQQVIIRHFALSVLLVDFPNPVYSSARRGLWKYVPAVGHVRDGGTDLAERTARAIVQAAASTPPDSPERQFIANWDRTPDQLRADAESRIQGYQAAILLRLKTQDGVNDYTRLAESRRRRFAATALDEFPLLLPKTNLPTGPDLGMLPDGSVGP
jgi:hypothetical protein